MNKNKITSLYEQIKNADSVFSVDNGTFIETISFADIEDKSYNEVIYFGWKDEEGNKYRVGITEEGLNNSYINEKGEIVLIDSEGDEFAIRLYEHKIIVPNQNW